MVGVADPQLPPHLLSASNCPNPFNPATRISYELPGAASVSLRIFDLEGRLVATLVDGWRDAGPQNCLWNGCDDAGRPVGSGVYVYRIEAGPYSLSQKMTLAK
jgi:flagellar hook assembly protein FlgD